MARKQTEQPVQQTPAEANEQRNQLARDGFDGTHPQYSEMVADLRGQYAEAIQRLELGRAAGQRYATASAEENLQFQQDSRWTHNPAVVLFDSPKEAVEAFLGAYQSKLQDPSRSDTTHVPKPTAGSRNYNFGGGATILGLDSSRIPGHEEPKPGPRGISYPVTMRFQLALADLHPDQIAKVQSRREEMGLPALRLDRDAEGRGRESIAIDVPTWFTGPRPVQFEDSFTAEGYPYKETPTNAKGEPQMGPALAQWPTRETATEFLREAHASLEDPSRIPDEFRCRNARLLKALGVDHAAGEKGPTALDVLTGGANKELAQLSPEDRTALIGDAHKVGAQLYVSQQTGLAQGAVVEMTLRATSDLFRKAVGQSLESQDPSRPTQAPRISSYGKMRVVGDGELLPANLSRTIVEMGGGPNAAGIASVRPNPFRNQATEMAYQSMQEQQAAQTRQQTGGVGR